jgi:hypothetical protein
MKRVSLILAFLFVTVMFLCAPLFSKDTKDFTLRKNPEIQHIKPKKPVRIKLKRTTEGKYTWDLTGDDVDEVVNTDRRLRKLLNVK